MFILPFLAEATSVGQDLNTALTNNISGTTIMGEFINVLPWIGTMVGVGFLIYEARKLIKGAQKGKARV